MEQVSATAVITMITNLCLQTANLNKETKQNVSQFFVDCDNINCGGFEETIQECTSNKFSPVLEYEAAALKCREFENINFKN